MAFVIKEYRPGKMRVVAGVVAMLWVASGWFAYQSGWNQSNHAHDDAIAREAGLQEELDKFDKLTNELQIQVSRLQRSAQVDRQAKVELAIEVKNLQDKQAELDEEISFYKSIISPEKGKQGLHIYSLEIMPAKDRLYHYKLVLTKSGKSDNLARGGVKVMLKGISQGKEKTLALSEVQVAGSRQLNYKFRYFQEFSGSFKLPENYSVREVRVELQPSSRRQSNSPVRIFDWHKMRRR